MKAKMLVYNPGDGDPRVFSNLEALTGNQRLEQFQAAVGGYIEIVPYFSTIEHEGQTHKCVAFCNEEGKNIGLQPNAQGDLLWAASLKEQQLWPQLRMLANGLDYLVGPIAIVIGDREFMDQL